MRARPLFEHVRQTRDCRLERQSWTAARARGRVTPLTRCVIASGDPIAAAGARRVRIVLATPLVVETGPVPIYSLAEFPLTGLSLRRFHESRCIIWDPRHSGRILDTNCFSGRAVSFLFLLSGRNENARPCVPSGRRGQVLAEACGETGHSGGLARPSCH